MKNRVYTCKRIVSVVMSAIVILSFFPLTLTDAEEKAMPANPIHHHTGKSDGSDYTDWSYIYFGSYPQSEVKSEGTKNMIDSELSKTGKTTGDVFVGQCKYRKVFQQDANYACYKNWKDNDGDYVVDEDYKYFKWEPIKWRVLQNDGTKLFVCADDALDSQEYNENYVDVTWETSTIRQWLNGGTDYNDPNRKGFTGYGFYGTAFSDDEKAAIIETLITNPDNPIWYTSDENGNKAYTDGGNDTLDRLFLLSYEELQDQSLGFCNEAGSQVWISSVSKSIVPTDYAHAMGALVGNDYREDDEEPRDSWNYSSWWTRTPGASQKCACDCGGTTGDCAGTEVNSFDIGVVPTLYLKVSSDCWSVCDDSNTIAADEVYKYNKFLSIFSNIWFYEYDSKKLDFAKLMGFAYNWSDTKAYKEKLDYLEYEKVSIEGKDRFYDKISLENINKVLNRFFGQTITDVQAKTAVSNNFNQNKVYSNGYYYNIAADGGCYNEFSVVSDIEQLDDGCIRVSFDIYELDPEIYWDVDPDFPDWVGLVHDRYFKMNANEAGSSDDLTYVESGVAILKPYIYEGTDTFQVLKLSRSDSDGYEKINIKYNTGETTVKVSDNLFSESSTVYKRELALLSGVLSAAAEGADSKDGDFLVKAYQALGFDDKNISLYSYPESQYNQNEIKRDGEEYAKDDNLAFSIAHKPITVDGETINLVVINARGSMTTWEFAMDRLTNASKNFYGYAAYDIVYDFEEDIFHGLCDYVDRHEELQDGRLKFLVVGHSLGGAAANLVAAKLTKYSSSSWASKDDIYCYTYGAIDSIVNRNVQDGFENIHNIYNFYDTFGPYGGRKYITAMGNSIYSKFGHIDLFAIDYRSEFLDYTAKRSVNHNIESYIKSIDVVSCNKSTDSFSGWFRMLFMCPIDVQIYCNKTLIGNIKNNEVDMESSLIHMFVDDGIKYLLLPRSSNYTYSIRVNATGEGNMNLYTEELGGDNSEICIENIELLEGKLFETDFSGEDTASDINLYVIEGNKKTKEVQKDGTEEEVFSIRYILNDGTDEGNPESYTRKSADFILTNPQKDGYRFIGWTGTNGSTPHLNVTVLNGTSGDLEFIANWQKIDGISENKNRETEPTKTSKPDATEKTSDAVTTDFSSQNENTKAIVKPARVKLKSLKQKKKATIKVSWKKTTADGYEVQYAFDKKFKKNKKKKKTSKNGLTIKKLKKGKTYYVRVRAYNYDGEDEKVYGVWSKVKKVKIKKGSIIFSM